MNETITRLHPRTPPSQSPLDGEWLIEACALLEREPSIVRVSVAQVRGSSPRETGASLFVTRAGQRGTIGGGNLEWQAVELGRRLLAEGDAPLLRRELKRLGPDLAQCCGGEVWLEFERIPQSARAGLEARRAAWRPAPKPALWVFGAGHVGSAVIRLLEDLPLFDVLWIDNRASLAHGSAAAHIEARFTPEPAELVSRAAPGTSFLVFTHDHELDYQICSTILVRNDAAWAGLIGSKSKAARFRSRLRRDGFTDRAIASLTCPVGATTIPSKLPAAIAVGIVAQLLALPVAEHATTSTTAGECDLNCGSCRANAAARSASAVLGLPV